MRTLFHRLAVLPVFLVALAVTQWERQSANASMEVTASTPSSIATGGAAARPMPMSASASFPLGEQSDRTFDLFGARAFAAPLNLDAVPGWPAAQHSVFVDVAKSNSPAEVTPMIPTSQSDMRWLSSIVPTSAVPNVMPDIDVTFQF